MKQLATVAALIAASATAASAGGIDRSGQSISPLFETGTYAEFSFGSVGPDVSGNAVAGLGGFGSGDMAGSYTQLGLAYKRDLSDTFSFALIIDQPFGADVNYPAGTNYFAQGSTAELDSSALTGLLRYKLANGMSFYGGIRYQTFEAVANIPFIPGGGYTGSAERDGGFGTVVGVSYERPEIALRVALTYSSEIIHELSTAETSSQGANSSTLTVETPQSINLDFQSGIVADTLLFGSIRWVDWSDFDISPADYSTVTGGASLVSYADDRVSYSLGVGRRFSPTWSGAVSLGYEKSAGGISSNLGPTDGNVSVGLGATYSSGNMKITGGVRYIWIGDAQTQVTGFSPASNFTDNTAIAAGVRVGFNF